MKIEVAGNEKNGEFFEWGFKQDYTSNTPMKLSKLVGLV
jgi:hypothetical protein